MKNQIVRFSPLQTAKVMSVLYFFMGVVFAVPMTLMTMLGGQPEGAEQNSAFSIIFLVMLPFLYALMSFIFVPIACWVYNLSAKWVGGIEVSLEVTDDT